MLNKIGFQILSCEAKKNALLGRFFIRQCLQGEILFLALVLF